MGFSRIHNAKKESFYVEFSIRDLAIQKNQTGIERLKAKSLRERLVVFRWVIYCKKRQIFLVLQYDKIRPNVMNVIIQSTW